MCYSAFFLKVRKSVTDCALAETDISSAEEMVEALKPMLVATNIMCEEKSPTISIIAPLHAQLLSDTTSSIGESPLVREIKGALHQDLSKRYKSVEEKDLLNISSALDPRFKSLLFLSPQEMQDTYAKLLLKAVALRQDTLVAQGQTKREGEGRVEEVSHSEEDNNDDSSTKSPKKRKSALLVLLGQTFKKTTSSASTPATSIAEREIKQYQDAPSLPLTEDPLIWWKTQEHVYPLLSRLARRHLCVPGTSVSAERVFSTAGDIISASRSALKSEHADQLLFLKKNMHI